MRELPDAEKQASSGLEQCVCAVLCRGSRRATFPLCHWVMLTPCSAICSPTPLLPSLSHEEPQDGRGPMWILWDTPGSPQPEALTDSHWQGLSYVGCHSPRVGGGHGVGRGCVAPESSAKHCQSMTLTTGQDLHPSTPRVPFGTCWVGQDRGQGQGGAGARCRAWKFEDSHLATWPMTSCAHRSEEAPTSLLGCVAS